MLYKHVFRRVVGQAPGQNSSLPESPGLQPKVALRPYWSIDARSQKAPQMLMLFLGRLF